MRKTITVDRKKMSVEDFSKAHGLTVQGDLYLRGTQITSLPDNLSVGGSLYLRGTQITSLPDNLSVGGYLDLRGTQITSLPPWTNRRRFASGGRGRNRFCSTRAPASKPNRQRSNRPWPEA